MSISKICSGCGERFQFGVQVAGIDYCCSACMDEEAALQLAALRRQVQDVITAVTPDEIVECLTELGMA